MVVTTYQVVASDMPNTSKRGRRRQHGEEESSEGLSSAAATPTPDDSVSPSSSAPNSPSPAASASASPSIESYGPLFQLEWHRVVLGKVVIRLCYPPNINEWFFRRSSADKE